MATAIAFIDSWPACAFFIRRFFRQAKKRNTHIIVLQMINFLLAPGLDDMCGFFGGIPPSCLLQS